ncbi:hypothetical protein AZO1586I_2475 [Bathymodiolus thermophilus thioautotrophic gill symbiont]|uniref:Uncharacterized protein n=1 Tax=Bathymodiolus thermophilus thioautotrophic gill symbiont TaxID=2360 RepID=A0ABM8MBS0_9GAMM|nr:hypothetical protein [Bathymodiolus thermophilus thioautotrophic gill symbiont]CAB5508200.1 hypothetical protein AZO1586I_2475 [Bathymodiolus thermophilus thioautotrophic gill symbiont]
MELNLLKNAGKALGFIVDGALKESKDSRPDYLINSSDDDCWDDELSAKQEHDMDSNGLSRSEATNNPHW